MMEVSLIIPSRIGMHTAGPLLEAIWESGGRVHLVVTREIYPTVSGLYGQRAESITLLEDLARRSRLAFRLSRVLITCLTRMDYSPTYRLRIEHGLGVSLESRRGRAFCGLLRLLPKARKQRISLLVKQIVQPFVKNMFPTKRIVAITLVGQSQLLCAKGQEVISITESWDHPSKVPVGYTSDLVFVWNENLGHDWRLFHGPEQIDIGYPTKLRYVLEREEAKGPELVVNTTGMVMYPATVSSNLSKRTFEEELGFIREVCEATRKAGKKLLVKPKPNGRRGDYDELRREYDHVTIGHYLHATSGSNYDLNEEYNATRLGELARCDLVINLHTTFALDAAAYGLPVMQLKMKDPLKYPYLTQAMERQHLKETYLKHEHLVFTVMPERPISDLLPDLWKNDEAQEKTREFSRFLRRWLSPKRPFRESMLHMASRCLAERLS